MFVYLLTPAGRHFRGVSGSPRRLQPLLRFMRETHKMCFSYPLQAKLVPCARSLAYQKSKAAAHFDWPLWATFHITRIFAPQTSLGRSNGKGSIVITECGRDVSYI